MGDGIDYYDLQQAKEDLQRQIQDLDRKLDRAIDDMRQSTRDSFVDVRGGIADLHDRLNGLETRL
jgi:hypothetical protein